MLDSDEQNTKHIFLVILLPSLPQDETRFNLDETRFALYFIMSLTYHYFHHIFSAVKLFVYIGV